MPNEVHGTTERDEVTCKRCLGMLERRDAIGARQGPADGPGPVPIVDPGEGTPAAGPAPQDPEQCPTCGHLPYQGTPTRVDLLREEFADSRQAVRDMQDAGSYQALVAGRRQMLQLHDELRGLEEELAERSKQTRSAEQAFLRLRQAVLKMPLQFVERLDDVVQSRLDPDRPLVLDDGEED